MNFRLRLSLANERTQNSAIHRGGLRNEVAVIFKSIEYQPWRQLLSVLGKNRTLAQFINHVPHF